MNFGQKIFSEPLPRAWEKEKPSMVGNPVKGAFLKGIIFLLTSPESDRVNRMLLKKENFMLNNFEMEF